MFNSEAGNVRAYAVAGSFDDCHRLTREAFGDAALRERVRLTSANSVNIGRLLPQMVYYFHAVAAAARLHPEILGTLADGTASPALVVCTPSGNFGNLTAGLMAKRAGLPVARFVAATNVNDVVPEYLATGRFEPRPSVRTIANAMDVGDPSNFERMLWLYGADADAMRQDISGTRHTDAEVRDTIKRVYDTRKYLLDPHSAIAYLGLKTHLANTGAPAAIPSRGRESRGEVSASERAGGGAPAPVQESGRASAIGIFLATAHPAKFSEIVEPIIGRRVQTPGRLADALARPRHILRMDASLDAVAEALRA
jgi:threonine synthase